MFSGDINVVDFSFWIVTASMAAATLFFILERFEVNPKWKTSLTVAALITGIAFWLGALLPFRWMCLQRDTDNLGELARSFGVLAIVYVGLILIAGLGYAYLLLGDVSLIFSTRYGNVLLIKMVFVSALLSLAALNKFKFVPALEINPSQVVRQFQSSVQFEIALAIIILITSGILTTSMTLPMGM